MGSSYRNNADPHQVENTPDGMKKHGRPFERGTSGNSKGRPRGSRNRSTTLQEKLDAQSEVVWDVIIQLAAQRDPQALGIIADRTVAPLREPSYRFDLPEIKTWHDIPRAGQAVITACQKGELPPSAAERYMGLIDSHRANLLLAQEDETKVSDRSSLPKGPTFEEAASKFEMLTGIRLARSLEEDEQQAPQKEHYS